MKKTLVLLFTFSLILATLSGCTPNTVTETAAVTETAEPETYKTETVEAESVTPAVFSPEVQAETDTKQEITIIYTNDIHSYIYNNITDSETNVTVPGLRLSSAAAIKKDLLAEGKNVLLVDCGDEIQGSIYGSFDKGETLINIMNKAGYDLATPGNHEFDFGMDNFFDRIGQAKFSFVSCSFLYAEDQKMVLEPYKIFDFNGTKVAFVGISTPQTIGASAISIFQDKNHKQLYTFSGLTDSAELYRDVQTTIDAVRDKADYVIGLGHLGVDFESQQNGVSSMDLIANTEGFDAFIDGHSHTAMPSELYTDKSGKEVLLTQTGSHLDSIGIMTISSDGTVCSELISDYSSNDAETAELEDSYDAFIKEMTSTKIGELETSLCTHDPESTVLRIIRLRETNLGDFVTDAYYWYLNEVIDSPCDVVLDNGGDLRTSIEAGDITYMNIKNVVPFDNAVCQIKVSGAELRDILENGAIIIGLWNSELNQPSEDGNFMHAAGIRYTIDASVTSSVEKNGGIFERVAGDYKVVDLQVYNRETARYEDVDPNRYYTLGGINYFLQNGGCGLTFLQDNECVQYYVGPQDELLIEYVQAFKKSGEYSVINSANSPLASWKNYLLNYESPYGAGRIAIINQNLK